MAENECKPNPQEKTVKKIHAWVQTFGIISVSFIGLVWGVYSFVYKEIIIPKSAPVNITLDFVLQTSGKGAVNRDQQQNNLIPIELKVNAKNPCVRTVNLLPSIFIIYGIKIKPISDNDKDMVERLTKQVFENNSQIFLKKYSSDLDVSVVAVGNLLRYDFLFPNEVESRSYLFYLPKGKYDALSAYAFIPTAKDTKHTKIKYNFKLKDGKLVHTTSFFGLDQQGKHVDLPRDEFGEYDKRLEIQAAETTQMISLW